MAAKRQSPVASVSETAQAATSRSHANSASGARIAVSFARAASENQSAVCQVAGFSHSCGDPRRSVRLRPDRDGRANFARRRQDRAPYSKSRRTATSLFATVSPAGTVQAGKMRRPAAWRCVSPPARSPQFSTTAPDRPSPAEDARWRAWSAESGFRSAADRARPARSSRLRPRSTAVAAGERADASSAAKVRANSSAGWMPRERMASEFSMRSRCGMDAQWTGPGAIIRGSSLISPKVLSYPATFCCRMADRAFACCGLK